MLSHSIPFTGTVTSSISVIMLVAWLYVIRQVRKQNTPPQRPVIFLNRYFLYMCLFTFCLSVPYAWLGSPSQFGLAMAYGYVVGHIFCYLAFMHITRMVFALSPRFANKDKLAVWLWTIATIAMTALNFKTGILGTHPVFNQARGLTEFNTVPLVGALIGVLSAASIIPALVLFARSTIKAHGSDRVKPLLLTLGFLVIMVAGPMHDVARTGTMYATADILSMVSVTILCTGVVFRIEHRLDEAPAMPAYIPAASNTL